MFKKKLSLFIFFSFCITSTIYCQCLTNEEVLKKIFSIENDITFTNKQKLADFYALKNNVEQCRLQKDSVYAWVFLKLGKYEFIVNKDYKSAISLTQVALTVNNFSAKGKSDYLNINAYFNLASSNEALLFYSNALSYYDSSIFLCRNFADTNSFVLDARLHRATIYFSSGDYQKAIEESIKGIYLSEIEKNINDEISFLNMQAQSYLFENNVAEGLPAAHSAAIMAGKTNNLFELATAFKTIALIYRKKNLSDSAKYYYTKAINARLKTTFYSSIASDYNDFGNFYHGLDDYKNADKNYKLFLAYTDKIIDPVDKSMQKALAYLNIGENFFQQNQLQDAETYYLKSLNTLNLNISNIIQNSPTKKIMSFSGNAGLVIGLMSNKTKLLLEEFKKTQRIELLNACIETAFITDSVITQIRHVHIGEQSKLYWRDKTNDFYANAIEACYYEHNAAHAFYFLEKSRAMLLNDKLNELNASLHLPESEARKEENYQLEIVELEQKLSAINIRSKEFENLQLQLITAKENFERYIKSLEIKYPLYYQNKYNDVVPSIQQLQLYLKKERQSFVHYFISDTATYILAITPISTNFIRVSSGDIFNQLNLFLQYCTNKQKLMNHYDSFALISNTIYKNIFQPLHLSKGKIIVCTNRIVIPFDALCVNEQGKDFLLNEYIFSYVYSAQTLLKSVISPKPQGNFLGFAPVSFAAYLDVQPLTNSADALESSGKYYSNEKLFTYENATRTNFFKYVSAYSVVNIFSHAKGDTSNNEPVLILQDSLIHLSELQMLNNPAAKLVLLSACETNVGKAATGEGIYSLARGFATAGIPSISATLWKADEQSIYCISEKFNQYLAEGMDKDEALQKAKSDFIQGNKGTEKLLPYYWANMVLIGNADAIKFTSNNTHYYWWIIALIAALISVMVVIKLKWNKN